MSDPERSLSLRESLITVVEDRLVIHDLDGEVDDHTLASLIVDDILSSTVRVEYDTMMLSRGKDAGFERALRDAIAAVGEVVRHPHDMAGYEPRLINYIEAQKAVARLSAHGMIDIFQDDENTGDQHDPDQGGIVPPHILDKIKEHAND